MKFRTLATATMLAGVLYAACSTKSDSDDADNGGGGNGGDAGSAAGSNGGGGQGGDAGGNGDGGDGGANSGGDGGGGGASSGGSGGSGGSGSGGSGGSASGGSGGSSSGGSGGSGGGGSGGGGAGGGGAGGGGAGGAGKPTAVAQIQAIGGGTITGTATFTQDGNDVTVVIALANCPAGKHGIHIHDGTGCANNNEQGSHWGPTRGEGIGGTGEITCDSDMKANLTYTRLGSNASLKWNIGGPATSDIVGHPLIVHGLVNSDRHGCGVITKQ